MSTKRLKREKVKTPFARNVKSFLRRFAPPIVWVGAVFSIFLVYQYIPRHGTALGIVDRKSVIVAPLVDGAITQLNVRLYDEVTSGAVLAVLDDALYQKRIATARAELERLSAEIKAENEKIRVELATLRLELDIDSETLERDNINDRRRFELNVEEAKLDLLDRLVTQAADEVALTRLRVFARMYKDLTDQGIGKKIDAQESELQVTTMEKKIGENKKSIAYTEEMIKGAEQRRDASKSSLDRLAAQGAARDTSALTPDLAILQAPFEAAIKLQNAQIGELIEEGKQLVLRAPIDGVITSLNYSPGQTIFRGAELLEIETKTSNLVVVYIDQADLKNLNIKKNARVQLFSRYFPSDTVEAQVSEIADKIDRYPLRLRPNPDLPKWGLAVQVRRPDGAPFDSFYPGEVLEVLFHVDSSADNSAP